jgi:hypothetical protein
MTCENGLVVIRNEARTFEDSQPVVVLWNEEQSLKMGKRVHSVEEILWVLREAESGTWL